MGCVYKITNTVNGKCYIGLTVNTAEDRFKKHVSMIYSNGCSALYSAMSKYGVDNFTVNTLYESDNKNYLMEMEKHYVKELNTLSPNGYNLTTGGESCIVSDETKEKLRKALTGRKIPWADKVSESVRRLWLNDEYRNKQVEQRKQKRGKYREGIVKPLRKDLPIEEIQIRYNNGDTINKISKDFNVSFYTIKRRLDL